MTRTSPPQVSFSSGEVSSLLHRRFDYQRYQTGVRICRGFLPMAEGALTRAPGTWYRGRTLADAPARLLPFQFAADDAVVLEFTANAMRVWRYGELVMDGAEPYQLATPYSAESLPHLRWVQSADVIYLVDQGLHPIQRLSRYALDHWTIGDQQIDDGPFRVQNIERDQTMQASAATGAISLTSDFDLFTAAHVGSLIRLQRVGSASVPLWVANAQRRIGDRVAHGGNTYLLLAWDDSIATTSGTADLTPEVTIPPQAELVDGSVVWKLIAAGTWPERKPSTSYRIGDRVNFGGQSWEMDRRQSWIWSANESRSIGENPPLHDEGDVLAFGGGPVWRFEDDGTGIARISAVTDARHASAAVLRQIPQECVTHATYRWSEGAWSEIYGWPSALEILDQRLVAAATPAEPRSVWFSVVGAFTSFAEGTEADEAFAYTVAGSGSINRVVNIYSGRTGLNIFALGEEYSARSETRAQVIGPTTAVFGRDSSIGSSPARPIGPAGDPIFISRDRRRVHVISYSLEADANRPVELTRSARHLGAGKFEEIVWQGVPLSIAWLRQENGDLAAMIYEASEEILGWAVLPVAGGAVESLVVSPSPDGSLDVVTMVIRREVDGAMVRMVEEMAVPFGAMTEELGSDQANHLFAAARFAREVPASVFHLPHLPGATVSAWTSEGYLDGLPVSPAGDVALPYEVEWAIIGLFDPTHLIETLDIVAQSPEGSTMGRQKRLHDRGGIGLHATAQLRAQTIERTFGQPDKVNPARNLVERPAASRGVDLFSGVASAIPQTGQSTELYVRFIPVGGAPATLTALVPHTQEAGR